MAAPAETSATTSVRKPCSTRPHHSAASVPAQATGHLAPERPAAYRPQPMTGPLRHAAYRRVWLAALVSNVGTWMHEAAGAWLMTTLAPSPFTVALMQTAATLPFFLLAFPAGAVADVVDRRRLLLATQTWMALAAVAL